MPELPEVETVKNVLAHVFTNRTIEKIFHPNGNQNKAGAAITVSDKRGFKP